MTARSSAAHEVLVAYEPQAPRRLPVRSCSCHARHRSCPCRFNSSLQLAILDVQVSVTPDNGPHRDRVNLYSPRSRRGLRRRMARTRATNSGGEQKPPITSSASWSSAAMVSSLSADGAKMMTGTDIFRRSSEHSSKPSTSGSRRSISTRSGCWTRRIASASLISKPYATSVHPIGQIVPGALVAIC
jgi:hypothetical protein